MISGETALVERANKVKKNMRESTAQMALFLLH